MALYPGFDPSLAGGRGGYILGSFQGGPDPNSGRDTIAQALLAQQGFYPPQADIFPHSPASSPDMQTGFGAFGGRGGADREGFGENVGDPALASPSFSEPGAVTVSGFGRGGDDTSAQSQANQAADKAALAESVGGRGATTTSGWGGAAGLPGAGGFASGFGQVGAPAATGWGGWGDYAGSMATPAGSALTEGMGGKGDRGYALGDYAPNFDRTFAEDFSPSQTSQPAVAQPTGPTMVGTVTPSGYTQPGVPGQPGDPSDPGNSGQGWGGGPVSGGGFGGFGAFGGGAATGGFEGSASMSNTGGAQGFSPGGGGYGDFSAASPGTGGYSAGAFDAGFAAGAQAASDAMGGGPGGGAGDTSGSSGGGGAAAGGNDPGGGDPGGGGVG